MSLSTDYGPDSGGRIKGSCIVKPIVYGNVSRYFGKKREEDGHTHRWTVYVKPYINEDMSQYVKKVHFKLHESYANPNRIITKPPYEVSETGWGEFEIVIKVYFNDPNERPVTMYHILKLFQTSSRDPSGNVLAPAVPLDPNQNLVSETYDEIVFQDPTQLMQSMLANVKPITTGPWKHDTNFEEKKEKTLKAITDAKETLKNENVKLREDISAQRELIAKYKTKLETSGAVIKVETIEK